MKLLECHSSSSNNIFPFSCTFIRSENTSGCKSFLDSSIKERDPIVISSESGQVALALGYITAINTMSVTVEVDKPLMEAVAGSNVLYRIDKDQLSGGSNIGRNSLINLFIDPKSVKLRDLIVDLKTPFFSSAKAEICDSRLNADQKSAIGKVLSGTLIS
jgi:DNA replication ATP-dependent helicase Dna2